MAPSGVATAAVVLGAVFTVLWIILVIMIIAAAARSGDYQACVNNALSNGGDVSTCTP